MPDEPQESQLMPIGGPTQSMFTSLVMTTPEHRKLFLKCMQDCDAKLTEQINKTINVTDYVIHSAMFTDKNTGEIVSGERLVLIDVDKVTYECMSALIIKSLRGVAFAYGKPPWEKGLPLTVKMRRNGEKQYYFLDPA